MTAPRRDETQESLLRRLKPEIDRYPRGSFVAVYDGRVMTASADFDELETLIRAHGIDPRETLVVEADVDDPDYVTIFV